MESTQLKPPRSALAPTILLVGDLILRGLTYAEHLDFLLSVRDEKFAMLLQFFRDSGWWIIAAASAVWLLYEWKWNAASPNSTRSVGAVVFSAAFLAFFLGVLVTVSATASPSLPNILQNYGGEVSGNEGICSALVDTSRLVGFSDGYLLILVCGAQDPTIDAQEDTRIAVSSGFHINGGPMNIVTPIGKIEEVWKDKRVPAGQSIQFSMWHTVAVIPDDVDPSTIKRASDIRRMHGRVLTDPIGGSGSPMIISPAQSTPQTPTEPGVKGKG